MRINSLLSVRWPMVCALLVGLAGCATTLPPPHVFVAETMAERPVETAEVAADIRLHNAGVPFVVEVSLLAEFAEIDCSMVLEHPDEIPSWMFSRRLRWRQESEENAAIWPIDARGPMAVARGCYVVRLRIDDGVPIVVAWAASDVVAIERFGAVDGTGLSIARRGQTVDVSVLGPVTVSTR